MLKTSGGKMVMVLRILLFLTSGLVLASAISCDLLSHPETSLTSNPTVSAPNLTVVGGELWGEGNWFIAFDGAEWHGCTITVHVSITYHGDTVAVFGRDDIYNFGRSLLIYDKYGHVFYSTYYETEGPWEDWYQLKYYPDETRRGTVEFTVDPRSESIWLYIEGKYTGSPEEIFYLYDVPTSCQ